MRYFEECRVCEKENISNKKGNCKECNCSNCSKNSIGGRKEYKPVCLACTKENINLRKKIY